MTSAQHDTAAATPTSRLAALRGNCMGAAVFSTVFGSAALAAHAIEALVLLAAAIGALVRAIRSRRAVVLTSVGLAAIIAAAIAGSLFVNKQSNGASLSMALATAVAMFCYLAAVFKLR